MAPELEQHLIADELLGLHAGILQKHSAKQRCITLDEQMGKSRKHKNAVSICRSFVGFMVGTDALSAFAQEADSLGLASKYKEEHRALRFPKLQLENIRRNKDFFLRILVEAKRESQRRQGYYHFASSGADIGDVRINGHNVDSVWLTRFANSGNGKTESLEEVQKSFLQQFPQDPSALVHEK